VNAVRAGELLAAGALEAEAASRQRGPGLSIVILPATGGEPQVAYQASPPMPMPLQIDAAPAPEAEPVSSDTE
jgi:hypothetical protein